MHSWNMALQHLGAYRDTKEGEGSAVVEMSASPASSMTSNFANMEVSR